MQDSGHNQVRWFCQGLVWLGFQGVSLRERRPRWRGPGEGQEHAGDISEGVWISVISMSLWAKGPRGPTVPRSPRVGALLPPRVSPLQVSWGPRGGELRGVLGFLRGGRGLWRHHRRSCVTRPARDAGDQANRVAAPHPDRVAGLIVWPGQARALETCPDRRRALPNRERRRNSSCSIRQRGNVLHALASARWMRGSRSCGRLLPLEQSTKVHTRQAEISVKSKLRASTDSYGSSHERERFNSCHDCSAS